MSKPSMYPPQVMALAAFSIAWLSASACHGSRFTFQGVERHGPYGVDAAASLQPQEQEGATWPLGRGNLKAGNAVCPVNPRF